ncbi:hypothetical protein M413DRAFT_31296 [Hebeloma cylindrosporum]|uniref:F-box domain-containing protein n=1 Tax=Hebeloma cylindrosporum TaxID=76867 RepID=A0A0C3BXW5_HEBCY|nr:hypothetical protein M413DRAFT_31296 [Hebeloma cylindrosporum h7]
MTVEYLKSQCKGLTERAFQAAAGVPRKLGIQKGILPPIGNIPREILEEIFIATHSPCWPQRVRVADLPWALSQVCWIWRDTALKMPTLWATLPTIDLGVDSDNSAKNLILLVKLFIRRSGVHGLTLQIILDPYSSPHPDLIEVVDVLVANSTRWRRVSMEPRDRLIERMNGIKGRLEELEALHLNVGHSLPPDRNDIDLFQSAPKLKQVCIEGRPVPDRSILLPYSQLTDYSSEGDNKHLSDLLGTPRPNLQRLSTRKISAYYMRMLSPIRPSMLSSVSNLTKLVFEFPFPSNESSLHILDALVLPVIEDLRLTSRYDENLVSSVSSLISRSRSSTLKTLCLHMGRHHVPPGELIPLLRHTPSLEHLSITLPPAKDITHLSCNPAVAPQLRTCGFYISHIHSLPDVLAALNLLTKCCEDIEDTDLHSNGSRTLQTVYLQRSFPYTPPHAFEEKQRELGGWSSLTQTHDDFCWLKKSLYKYFPEIDPQSWSEVDYQPSKDSMSSKAKRLLLLSIAKDLPVTEVAEIYASGIHHALMIISKSRNGKYRRATEKVLEKWRPLIEESAEDLHWAMVERQHLIYLSKRNSSVIPSS